MVVWRISLACRADERRQAGKLPSCQTPAGFTPWPHVRLSETDRLEPFSDNVLSITITLLVAEIVRPDYASGQLLEKLAAQWASYIAFLASFCYAGVIWLNHRAMFARVRYCDRGLHLANLFLLPDVGADSFSDGHPARSHPGGNEFDAKVAVTLYASHCRVDVPGMARRVPRSEHTSVPCGGRRKSGLFPKGAPPRHARRCLVRHRGRGGLAIDTKGGFADLPGLAGLLRHHQRGVDGNTDPPPIWKKASWRFSEEQSRGAAHRIALVGVAISRRPSAACNLHRRQPIFPHRRINRRAVSPFQAAYKKLDLACGLALAPPNGLQEDPHRVIALNYGDRVGRFHDGHVW